MKVEDKNSDSAIALEAVFLCEMQYHTMYSGSLYLYSDSVDGIVVGKVSGLTFSKLYTNVYVCFLFDLLHSLF